VGSQDILKSVRDAGVIGAGGAGFPTYKKLEARVSNLIVNGAECEPLLYKDREVMLQDRDMMFRGLAAMQEVTGASQVTIAVKRKNADVLEPMRAQADAAGYDLYVYDDVYPAGDEYVLVYDLTGRQIPPGGLPLDVGCVVDNVETIANIGRAVDSDQPVIDKYITVTGAVEKPQTMTVPVGTSFEDCLAAAGGVTTDDPTVLTGGVMMGGIVHGTSGVITKTIGGLIVLPSDHYLVQRKSASQETYSRIGHGQCDQCSMCTELCPRYILGYPIEPHRVMRTLLMSGEAKELGSLWAQYCCECNICSLIACPESLDPKNICVDAKQLLREKKLGRSEKELETLFRPPHPARDGRQIPIATLYQRLGLTPYDRKAAFVEQQWEPSQVTIPLNTHIGAPATPTVQVGNSVKRGEVIGTVEDQKLGCPVHASVSGQVTSVNSTSIEIATDR
jgi:Na+-translocating ferredoxin:NAD+ oxidoreductase RnfC subunit